MPARVDAECDADVADHTGGLLAIILVMGLWLDASSREPVVAILAARSSNPRPADA